MMSQGYIHYGSMPAQTKTTKRTRDVYTMLHQRSLEVDTTSHRRSVPLSIFFMVLEMTFF